MEARVPWYLTLKLLLTILMVILLNTSHHGVTAVTISLTKGNDSTTVICTGKCLVDDQYADLELLMMGSEISRRLQGITFTQNSGIRNRAYTCGRPAPTCGGPATGAPKGENCDSNGYNRACHQFQ